jgi:hypothetical protein
MIEIIAPKRFQRTYLRGPSIFLAGSIEMGKAEMWQNRVKDELKDLKVNIYNPRRDDWDPTWEQSVDHPQFVEQVNWELDHIANVDLVLFYFDPYTKAPITLLELGMVAEQGRKAIVCCPDGFYRQGNVQIVTGRNSIPFVRTFKEMIDQTKTFIHGWRF